MSRVKERPAKEAAARKRKAQLDEILDGRTDPKLIEPDHVLRMLDHDGEEIYIKVEDKFESKVGPSVRGFQYTSPTCEPKTYVMMRALPLSMLAPPPSQRAPRTRIARATGPGRCEHCGGETKGGRFIPGHDAKLKGDLVREATEEATAERIARGWTIAAKAMQDFSRPAQLRIGKLVEEGDAFITRRIAERIGE
jgi:hypothetical protein